jgi:multidrug efflux pump subunit AcrB
MQQRLFRTIDKVYARAQAFCFRRPALTLGMGLVAIALGVWMFLHTNIQMMPLAARDHFVVEMEVQGGAGTSRTQQLSDSLQHLMLQDARVVSCTAFTGTGAPRFNATYTPILPSSATAQIIVKTTSTLATEALLRKFERQYEHVFPDALIRFKQMDYQAVVAPMEVTLKGSDREALVAAADSIRAYMASLTELKWVHSDCADFRPTVEVTLDDDEASRLGVNKGTLALALAGSFGGQSIATLWEGDTKVPVRLYSEGVGEGMDYETVSNQLIPTALPSISVSLRQVAEVQPDWQPVQLGRVSSMPSVTIRADMKNGQSQPAAMKKVKQYVQERVVPILPEGTKVVYGGLSAMNKMVLPEIVLAFIAAVAVLFIFLLFHFKKVSVAVLTMAMSMLCLFGASIGLWVFRLDFGMTAVLGLISLVGIIVRNGILMYEYAEEQRFEQGVDVKTAAMEAGKRRMTPIFLTSCTTALGVLPMVIRGDLLWQPMGVVICFGTLLSIGLIVLIMPVSYWQLFKNEKGRMKNEE